MKRFYIIAIITLLTLSAWAVPARRIFTTYTQPDGTQVKLALVGDEHFHYLMTQDGVAMHKDGESGFFVPMDETLLTQGLESAAVRREMANRRRASRIESRFGNRALAASTKNIGVRSSIVGKKKGLVILVNFSDRYMVTPRSKFDEMFNKEGYNGDNHIGSVSDYFRDQSYGKLEIDFDVVGPVTMSQASTYYGKDRNSSDTDVNAHLMVIEACKAVDDQVNFSDYDWDGDGEVDQVFLIFAGYGAHYEGADSDWLWPAEWTLSSANYYYPSNQYPLKLDGVNIDTYAYAPELAYASGTTLNGIGTACHEFAHCLGLPDTYDTKYNLCPSMFDWDLMDSGSYNGANYLGEVPAGLTAYERWTAGWLELTELDGPRGVKDMPSLNDSACAYVIYNEGDRNEAYILENRQNSRWFSYPKNAHGLLIYHVDYDQSVWQYNKVNSTKSHPRLYVVPASGEIGDVYEEQGVYAPSDSQLRGHTWPGSTRNTAFTDSSTPAATLYNKNIDGTYLLGMPIESIREEKGLISFLVKGGDVLDVPVMTVGSGSAESGSVLLSWQEVPGATGYDLRMTAVLANSGPTEILNEPMGGSMYSMSYGNQNLSNELDAYLNNYGWTGTYVYKGPDGAKLGSSKISGMLQTPALEAEGLISFSALLTPYSNDDAKGKISLLNAQGKVINSVEFTATGKSQTFELAGAINPCYVRISPNKRVSVKNIKIEVRDASAVYDRLVENIQETKYEVGIQDGYEYSFEIRAISDMGMSPWSELLKIDAETGIEQLESKSLSVGTYDLNGRRITVEPKGLIVKQGKIVLMK